MRGVERGDKVVYCKTDKTDAEYGNSDAMIGYFEKGLPLTISSVSYSDKRAVCKFENDRCFAYSLEDLIKVL